jgi:hypothetical protein
MSQRNLGRWGLLLISVLGLLSVFSASALAAGPPIVTVNAANNLRLNSATGSGTVDKNGAANATVKIEYGKTKSYGQSITLWNKVTATGAVPVSELMTGLEPMATYHYRISATNSYGTTVSEDVAFEQLLQWKVAGKTLSELSYGPVIWEDYSGTWAFTGEGTLGGTSVKLSCEADYRGAESNAHGKLGVSYAFPLKGCKFFAKGIEQPACKPASLTSVEANGLLQTTSATSVNLGEECAFGESLPLPVGYGIAATSEGVRHSVTLLGHAGQLNFSLTNPEMELGGAYIGTAFGIS